MYDPKFNAWYRISDEKAVQNPRWYNGEPIWNTAEKQGLKAGVFFWVGSEAPIQHIRPTRWKHYDGSVPFKARIDTVVKWLSAPNGKAVNFAALYFSQPDHAGHEYGPQSDSVKVQIKRADNLIGYLKRKMKAKNLWNQTNIIIVSDHGMTELSKSKTIPLGKIINLKNVKRRIMGAVTMLQPKKGKEEAVYKTLKSHANHYRIYKKKNLPKRYHYRHSRRVFDLIIVADLGYTILTPKYKKRFLKSLPAGTHGYDPRNMQMHAIFLARGPTFKKGAKVKAFKNINIYDLMCHLLDLKPAANDGSLDNVKMVLKNK
jgi:predicted AlkP superfamily pyrophosphatase or phosphodiesterase